MPLAHQHPRSLLLGARRGLLPHINSRQGRPQPSLNDEAEAIIADLEADPSRPDEAKHAKRLLRNKVKKCPGCSKPNAFTLATCNNCGGSLEQVDLSHSTNIFMCFGLGVARGPFPLEISVRKETERCLVIDDLLALSPLHLNALPTDAHIPDWRFLLRRPREGLGVIRSMLEGLMESAREQFLSQPEWRAAAIKDNQTLEVDDFIIGFNFPPSQYQLHIQFMAPMLLPHHRYQYLRGTHYTKGRFFPYPYVDDLLRAVSESDTPVPSDVLQEDTPIEHIVKWAKDTYDIDYDLIHSHYYAHADTKYRKFANWKPEDFAYEAKENNQLELKILAPRDGSEAQDDAGDRIKALIEADKMELQNYGRPYTSEGKPKGSYYSFPKRIEEVALW
jgi:hypothetical protein